MNDLDPDDPQVLAEQLTQQWCDDNGYVGRRRAVADPILDDLVSSRLMVLCGEPLLSTEALARALVKLAKAGHDQAQATAEIRRMRVRVDIEAARIKAEMDGMTGLCGDPDECATAFFDVITWTQHRKRTGRCAQCGGQIPGGLV